MTRGDHPPCTVQYRKWDGALHWRHDMVRLGTDEYGIWLGAGVGATVQRGTEPVRQMAWAFVQLICADAPWTAIFNAPAPDSDAVYVDLSTPARWVEDDVVELIDLDLDVVRRRDGSIALLDEDEWVEHRVRYAYPTEVVDRTEAAADELLGLLRSRTEPFGTAAERWLSLVS